MADVFYNFDIAVPLLIAQYGQNTMNGFFIAAYKAGWPSNTFLAQRTEQPMDRVTVGDHPEEKFWGAVYNCYCLDRKRHVGVCQLMYHSIKKSGNQGAEGLKHQANTIVDALKADIRFYEPSNYKAIWATMDSEIGNKPMKVYPILDKYFAGSTDEYGRSKVELSRAINSREGSETGITLLKGLRAVFADMKLDSQTAVIPMGCQMFFRHKGGKEFLDFLNGMKSTNAFGPFYYNGHFGSALHFMYIKRSEPGAAAYWPVLKRYTRLLFYLNVNQAFLHYLNEFRDSHNRIQNPSFQMAYPASLGANALYHLSKLDDDPTLKWINDHVQTWDVYLTIRRGGNPMSGGRRIRGPTGASKSGGGSGLSG